MKALDTYPSAGHRTVGCRSTFVGGLTVAMWPAAVLLLVVLFLGDVSEGGRGGEHDDSGETTPTPATAATTKSHGRGATVTPAIQATATTATSSK